MLPTKLVTTTAVNAIIPRGGRNQVSHVGTPLESIGSSRRRKESNLAHHERLGSELDLVTVDRRHDRGDPRDRQRGAGDTNAARINSSKSAPRPPARFAPG